MAVMASHPPDTVPMDQQKTPKVGALEEKRSTEVNGHISPADTQPDLNGKGSDEETPANVEATANDSKNQVAFTNNQTLAEKDGEAYRRQSSPSKPGNEPGTTEADVPATTRTASVKTTPPESPSGVDTEMVDAPNGTSNDQRKNPNEPSNPQPEAAKPKDPEAETNGIAETDATVPGPEPMSETAPSHEGKPNEKGEASEGAKSEQAAGKQEDVDMANAPVVDPTSSAEQIETTQDTAVSDAPITSPSASDTLHQPNMSNLTLDTSQATREPGPLTADSSSTEPPQSSIKVSREREEDLQDERNPKRARTEETIEATAKGAGDVMAVDTPQPVPSGSASASRTAPAATSSPASTAVLDKFDNSEQDKQPIRDTFNREIRRVLAGVKKTKNGALFKDSVEKLWPTIWESYHLTVDSPMDIGLMERTLRTNEYKSLGMFKRDVKRLYANSFQFNGKDHNVTLAAHVVAEQILGRVSEISVAEPGKGTRHETKSGNARVHESRAAAQPQVQVPSQPRRVSQGPPVAASPSDKVAESPVFAVPASGVPIIRRDSAKNTDDKPKRPIHPPKNKDLEYGSRVTKKKMQPDLRFCDEVLNEVKKPKYQTFAHPFYQPVDPVALGIPDYFSFIKKPMDLETIENNLHAGHYKSAKDFYSHFNLMLKNCFKFNQPGQPVYEMGKQLEALFQEKWSDKDDWLAKNAPPTPVSHAAASSPHSGGGHDESEDEDSGPEAEPEAPTSNATIDALNARLKEENDKLAAMLGSSKPAMSLVTISQQTISMIQQELVKERLKLNEVASKKKKPKPKPAKVTKKAASGTAASKKASVSGGVSKKGGASASGGKKAAKPKVSIGPVEKEVVITGIAELDGADLQKAIDIIKRHTASEENDDGELELDIEKMPHEALVKLYSLINGVFPDLRRQKERELNPNAKDVVAQPAAPVPEAPKNPQLPKSSGKKKNKPMGKVEQERKIEQLRELKAQFARHGSGSQEPLPSVEEAAQQQSSDDESDSDSEEE